MRHISIGFLAALVALPVSGQEQDCPVEDLTGLTMLPPLNPPIAGAEVRKALMVCVTFPNIANPGIPVWLSPMAGEGVEGKLEEYIRKVSDGQQILDITFERRPAPFQNEPYMADFPDSYYRDLSAYAGGLNTEILLDVQANHLFEDPDYLARFDLVFMIYNGDPFSSNIGGVAGLFLSSEFLASTDFEGIGYSARLLNPGYQGNDINSHGNRLHSAWVQVHEYGHLLGFGHSPHSAIEDACRKLRGRYDPMQSQVPSFTEWDYHSYHVMNLLQVDWIPAERVVVPPGPTGPSSYELDDVRRGGDILKIPVFELGTAREYFLVLNHQGSDYDAKYPGTGLAIWHIREGGGTDWDLEVASGMFDPSCPDVPCAFPDPIAGTDKLDRTGQAHADDLWSSGIFSPASNPNTNSYQLLYCAIQKAISGVTISGITDVGSAVEFDLFLAPHPPPATFSYDVAAETFLGLDCDAAQDFGMPISATVFDVDGTPLVGVPGFWMMHLLTPISIPGGTLSFCGSFGVVPAPTTDSTGSAGNTLYHACGGGEFVGRFLVFGAVVAEAQGKLRTPDLDADGDVDVTDLGIWSNPSGPPEDDIRDFDFDLEINQEDFDLIAGQMNTVLEPNVNIVAEAPVSGSELIVGTSVTLESAQCVSGGESVLVSYLRLLSPQIDILGEGVDMTSFDWLVSPPLGSQELRYLATSTTLGSSVPAIVPVTLKAPKVAITPSFSPPTLNTIGAIGTVTVRLKNNETVPVSDITAQLLFPSGALEIMTGPLPSGPFDLAPGQWVDVRWTAMRDSGSGGVPAEVHLRLAGFPQIIKTKTFTAFGPNGGGNG